MPRLLDGNQAGGVVGRASPATGCASLVVDRDVDGRSIAAYFVVDHVECGHVVAALFVVGHGSAHGVDGNDFAPCFVGGRVDGGCVGGGRADGGVLMLLVYQVQLLYRVRYYPTTTVLGINHINRQAWVRVMMQVKL